MSQDKDKKPDDTPEGISGADAEKKTGSDLPLPASPDRVSTAEEKEPEKVEAGSATGPKGLSEDGAQDRPRFAAVFESLLKNPGEIISGFKGERSYRTTVKLAVTSLVCLLGFGFVIGTMSGGHQLWAAPLKVSGGVLVSALICLPSLYIFACLTGLDLRPGALAGLLAAGVCLAALLLVGFAPVAWLFGQSTDSTLFYGILCLAFWGIALYFAYGLIRQTISLFSIAKPHHLYIWCGIFALVTIQMSTSLRPIIGKADTFLPGEKKFFLEHWFQEVKIAGRGTVPVEGSDWSEGKRTASR